MLAEEAAQGGLGSDTATEQRSLEDVNREFIVAQTETLAAMKDQVLKKKRKKKKDRETIFGEESSSSRDSDSSGTETLRGSKGAVAKMKYRRLKERRPKRMIKTILANMAYALGEADIRKVRTKEYYRRIMCLKDHKTLGVQQWFLTEPIDHLLEELETLPPGAQMALLELLLRFGESSRQ